MTRIREALHILRSIPPREILRRAWSRAARAADRRRRRRADLAHETYSSSPLGANLSAYWPDVELPLEIEELAALRETCAHFVAHRFDLLGSGWVVVRHGMRCRGLGPWRMAPQPTPRIDAAGNWLEGRINGANLRPARQVWQLVDRDYVPIDWHLDFKSGYRWNESTWYRDIRFGHVGGADIKVPWELARMQHLPRLAWAYARAAAGSEGFDPPGVYAREFRNQVLDFIATNPPRFGVNWYSSMDVGIRVANWLVAYDWLRAAGASWDAEFDEAFLDSVLAHGRHILHNLDWNRAWRGNHYLTNVVGLLFVAAYVPRSAGSDAWLAFAVAQLIEEVRGQFAADGSHVEASTSYHRLAAEMVVFGTALVLALEPDRRRAFEHYDHRLIDHPPRLAPAPLPRYALLGRAGDSPFPPWYFERLERMAELTLHATKPTSQIHQVGDNDSGRFLKLHPVLCRLSVAEAKARFANLPQYDELPAQANYWAEDHLDHRALVAAAGGLFDRADFVCRGPGRIELPIVRRMVGDTPLKSKPHAATTNSGTHQQWQRLRQRLAADPGLQSCEHRIWLDPRLLQDLKRYAYPDFGLFIWRSSRFYLAARCGPRVQRGPGAHAHNDQLALELTIDGRDVLVDPGSCLYTPDPKCRNRYRSVAAHWVPQGARAREPGRFELGLFALDDRTAAECLYFGAQGFAGMHRGFGRPIYRVVELEPDAIIVTDFACRAATLDATWPNPSGDEYYARLPTSAGYGIVVTPNARRRAPDGIEASGRPIGQSVRSAG